MENENVKLEDIDPKNPSFQKWLRLYRIYRLVSAIIINIGELFIEEKFGRGWSIYYQYETKNE